MNPKSPSNTCAISGTNWNQDFCIAEIAEGLNKTADAEKYFARSSNWKNLFKQEQTSFIENGTKDTGFTGFFQPKYCKSVVQPQ